MPLCIFVNPVTGNACKRHAKKGFEMCSSHLGIGKEDQSEMMSFMTTEMTTNDDVEHMTEDTSPAKQNKDIDMNDTKVIKEAQKLFYREMKDNENIRNIVREKLQKVDLHHTEQVHSKNKITWKEVIPWQLILIVSNKEFFKLDTQTKMKYITEARQILSEKEKNKKTSSSYRTAVSMSESINVSKVV